jgi:hypothetical protein
VADVAVVQCCGTWYVQFEVVLIEEGEELVWLMLSDAMNVVDGSLQPVITETNELRDEDSGIEGEQLTSPHLTIHTEGRDSGGRRRRRRRAHRSNGGRGGGWSSEQWNTGGER